MLAALLQFALSNLAGDLKKLWDWLCHRSFWQLVCMGLAGFALLQHFQLADARHDRDAEHNARMADRDAYKRAQDHAAAQNKAHVEAVERKQEAITNEVRTDLNSRLERLRRELRDNPTAKGSAGTTALPKSGATPCRADDPAWLCLSPADRLRAVENEERHDQLITWTERQSRPD